MSVPAATKSRRQPNTASPVILPDELIAEVLSFLTVKSLMRLRCVSKSWNSLISDPTFVKMHLKRSAQNKHLTLPSLFLSSVVSFPIRRLLDNPSADLVDDRCYQLKDKDCRLVVGSCNGLLCLLGDSSTIEYREIWFHIWNPATRTISKKLGYLRLYAKDRSMEFTFGYDNSTNTYKVVGLRLDDYNKVQQRTEVRVFSLGHNVWRDIQGFPVVPFQVRYIRPAVNGNVYFSGTLNWLALCNNGHHSVLDWEAVDQLVIISLDLGTETHTQLLPPRGFDEMPRVEPNVCVLMDCFCFSHDFKRTDFVIWKMTEFGVEESWTQFLKISYENLQLINYDFGDLVTWLPLHLSENDDTLILANNLEDQAILYNWRDKRVKRTRSTNKICWFFANDFVESLLPPCLKNLYDHQFFLCPEASSSIN